MADESRDAGVDPRFDPQFQRGYDPAQHKPRPQTRPRVEERREATRLDTPAPDEPLVASTGSTTEDEPAVEYEHPRRNPFRLILLLSSLAALAGGALLLWHRITSDPYYYSGPLNDQGARFADTFLSALLPALTTSGLLGLTAWIALGALRRRDGD